MTFGLRTQADADHALMCRVSGCRNRWTVDILHGRVCSEHDAAFARGGSTAPPTREQHRHQAPIPLRDAVRPFAEPVEHDEDYRHAE